MQCGLPQSSLCGLLLSNMFVNDVNDFLSSLSLRLYAGDTTQYSASTCPVTLEVDLNGDIVRLSHWFSCNFMKINSNKSQAMVLGKGITHDFGFLVDSNTIDIKPTLKILVVTLDNKLCYKEHVALMLKKVYAKTAALRRINPLIPN